MLGLGSLAALVLAPVLSVVAASSDTFHESLTLHPLPDGKLSVLFEFTTFFNSPRSRSTPFPQSHHSLTPPSLILPLEYNNVSELSISFVAGRWDQARSGESGPLHYESGGGGGEVRGWLRGEDSQRTRDSWTAATHALGGLFCAGLGPTDDGETVKTFGGIYPPYRSNTTHITHYLILHPFLHLCTENLTPFLSLLPSKGLSGISTLLAHPGNVFSWGFKSEGIEVIMPDPSDITSQGRWRGWWEGVVDLVPERGGSRAFSINSLFKQNLPQSFPEASSSVLRVIKPSVYGDNRRWLMMDREAGRTQGMWIDGRWQEVVEWDLTEGMAGKDVKFYWHGEGTFAYPRTIEPPLISISKTVTSAYASEGTFSIRITNNGNHRRRAIYSEIWPWWVKGWMSEMRLAIVGEDIDRSDLLDRLAYHPSSPPKSSTTSIHLSLTLPARSTLLLSIPFTKLTIKYTEHRPDAERGVEIPSGVLTLLDLDSESSSEQDLQRHYGETDPRKSGRQHIYTSRILLDVPTPDFSMPYNVIIMSSTVMAVFFGLMQGSLTRRWGFVDVSGAAPETAELDGEEDKVTGEPPVGDEKNKS